MKLSNFIKTGFTLRVGDRLVSTGAGAHTTIEDPKNIPEIMRILQDLIKHGMEDKLLIIEAALRKPHELPPFASCSDKQLCLFERGLWKPNLKFLASLFDDEQTIDYRFSESYEDTFANYKGCMVSFEEDGEEIGRGELVGQHKSNMWVIDPDGNYAIVDVNPKKGVQMAILLDEEA